ncbi:MAG: WecB/TagA/CpsF family glycosyltransferase [Nitrosomonadales bacterium]|nr:WecB/TagA/CpsF family glycosyltransferase [Nitrosomonadales bacterium]
MDTRKVFGLDIAALTREAAVDMLERRIRERSPVRLAFVNANLANIAYENAHLHGVLRQFLLLNDGVGLDIASRILYGKPFPYNLNGTDFTPYFLDQCRTPLNVFLLGAKPAVIARVAEIFPRRWPQHNLVGYQDGFFAKPDEARVIETIRAAKPDLLLVAMGNGLQEQWIERLVPEVALSAWGIGAWFDFLSDEVPRAPLWMRRLRIEWVFRLMLEPRRMWRRYIIGNPKFVLRVLRERRLAGGGM